MRGVANKVVEFIRLETLGFILAVSLPLAIFQYLARKKRVSFELRRLPMLDFVEDLVRSAAEQGRPIMVCTGTKIVLGQTMYQMMFVVLSHLCKFAAGHNVRTIITNAQPAVAPVIVDYAKEGYFQAGHPDRFNIADVYSFSDGYHAEPLGNVEIINKYRPAAVIYLGQYNWNFCIMPMGAANILNIPQAALNNNPDSHTFASVLCSRTVTSHDTVAMGMYLKKDPVESAIMTGQDITMIVITAFLWVSFLLQLAKIKIW